MDAHAAPFRLRLASLSPRALGVSELRGAERLSRAYRFDVTCTAAEPLPPLADLLQMPAALVFCNADPPRIFSGAVEAVWHQGTRRDADHSEQVRIRIAPRFALRKHRQNSRIFQQCTVPDIVRTVLAEAGVRVEMRLQQRYPERVYCTQYRESDTTFVSRILAEAGIFSFWMPPAAGADEIAEMDPLLFEGDTLVLGDTPAAYQEAATAKLHFLRSEGTVGHDAGRVTRFVPRERVRPERATFREYDAERPRVVLEAEAGRAGAPLERYEHEAPFLFASWKSTQEEPQRLLSAARRDARLARGESSAPHLAAGHRFTLEEHPWEPANGAHVVVELRHEGWSIPHGAGAERYRNEFTTAPAALAILPKVPRERSMGFTLTATVTGPPGEEIHTDERGRVKVQFHWDREGKRDAQSSCWLAVMQSWSGTAWGSQFIPRVGMEVVVSFEGGDPDKPLILGCLPNGTHPPPFPLPISKTKSGLRTQSSPGGGGFNELSFEDRAGEERIYLVAQRDLEEVVGNDRTRVVRANEDVSIQGREHRAVGGSREAEVEGDVTETIQGEQRIAVAGAHRASYASGALTTVGGDADVRVSGAHTLRVQGEHRAEVQGAARRETKGDVIDRTWGSHALVVGDAGSPRSFTLHTEGTAMLRGSEELVLESAKALTLRVGKTMVRLTEHGIELHGETILVQGKEGSLAAGDDGITLRTTKKAEIAADTVHLHTTGDATVLSMKKDVKVSGSKILLNSPENSKDPRPEDPPPPTSIALCDQEGKPIPHQRFVIGLDGGKERSGLLDERGRVELLLEPGGEATIRFPELPPPTADKGSTWVPHVVQAGEFLDKIAHRLGFPPELLWSDPKNAELRRARPSPNLLSPGDVLWVPRDRPRGEEPLSIGAENRFERRVPTIRVVVWLHRADGSPIADEACEVKELGIKVTSGADGRVELLLPIHVREAALWIPSLHVAQSILVGDLDPPDTQAGIKQRLANLGYGKYHGFDDAPGAAILLFQKDHELPQTGVADAATVLALKAAHDGGGGS